MSTSPVSRVAELDAFLETVTAAKAVELRRAGELTGEIRGPITTPLPRRDRETLEQQRQLAQQQVRDAVGLVMGGASGVPGTMLDLQVVAMQGDFCDRRHRAAVLRNISRVRRIVHTASRRESHGGASGYYDRRVLTPVTDLLLRAKR